jgi:predicted Zn-dependent protease
MIAFALLLLLRVPDSVRPPANAAAFSKIAAEADEARQSNRSVEAIGLYRRALALKSSWKEGWWSVGTIEYQLDRYAECRDSFQHLTGLEGNGGPAWAMLGLCDYGVKDYKQALAHLEHGQELGLSNAAIKQVAQYHLAELYIRIEDYERALGTIAELAHWAKEDPRLITIGGIAALRRPVLPEALPAEDRELAYFAGKAFWDAGARRAADAQKSFDILLSKYPSKSGVHFLYGTFLLQNNPDGAIAEFQKELEISPEHVAARTALAFEYLRRGDAVKALPYAKEAVQLFPNSLAPHVLFGRSLAESGDLEAGRRELEIAVKIAPADPQPRIALASVYAKLGRTEDAARERREFLRLNELNKRAGDR